MPTIEENINRFETLMSRVSRDGRENFMEHLRENTDFYKAPASTQYHLSCEGGLLQHSLNVYDCMMAKKDNPIWKKVFENVPEESIIIMSLLHDLCKINFYVQGTKNQKTYDPEKVAAATPREVKNDSLGSFIWETVLRYEVNDVIPLGHGEKSIILINMYMKLTEKEIFAIRWHMGFSEEKPQYNTLGAAMEKYPIVLALYESDLEASKILEDKNGNKE